jgi:class 3 adenylate cyclase
MNDIARARRVYERAVVETPAHDAQQLRHLKERISSIYILPTNSKKTIEEGLRILDELESYYRSHPEDSENLDSVIYNKGLTRMLAFTDYKGMIRDFQRISNSFFGWTDAQIFLALAYVRTGEPDKAKALLKQVNLANYSSRDRIPFLHCFLAVVREELKEAADLNACVQLPEDTQSEVIIYITDELSKKNLAPSIEIALWRQFWKFYSTKILKKINEQSDIFINSIELQRAKSDSMIKTLELKNFQLVKVILAITALALVVSFVLFLRLRSRSSKIEKLQAYIHKSVLARFLPPMIVEEIIQGKSRIDSKPHEMLITVIFCDLVGFTALSEKLSASTVSEILNRFMNSMTQVVYKHEGTIDKFIGDAVMVIFGAPMPLSDKDQATRAVACSRDMMSAMDQLNQEFEQEFHLSMRVGIHQGNAIVGTFGNEKRSDFTAVGLTVNMASRIEAKAQPNEILISPQVARHLSSEQFQARGKFQLRGIADAILLHAVVKVQDPLKDERLSG